MMLQSDYELIIQKIQNLTRQIRAIDDRIGALQAEAIGSDIALYFIEQREIDRLLRVQRALQDKWNTAMNELAIYLSLNPARPRTDAS